MVRTGNVDFSCKRLTSIEIRKSKYHIISAFSVGPPLRKISGSTLVPQCILSFPKQISNFQTHLFCLQMLSIAISLKTCSLVKS